VRSLSRSHSCRALLATGPGFGGPVSPRPVFIAGTTGSPRFLGNPLCPCPALRPRWDLHARPLRRFGAAFRSFYDVGSHNKPLSGLHHTAWSLAVYASPPGLPQVNDRVADRRGCPHGSRFLPAPTPLVMEFSSNQREVKVCRHQRGIHNFGPPDSAYSTYAAHPPSLGQRLRL
jgi:hypothetical protein